MITGNLIPMDTIYDGFHFRSRLEARWAVFFNAMGWKYDYEVECLLLTSGPYMPDFYFPELNIWAEVKPDVLSKTELGRCIEVSEKMNSNSIGVDVILLEGKPSKSTYRTIINGNTGIDIVFVGKDEAYYPFVAAYDYNEKNAFLDQTNEAVSKAQKARFEFEWKENHER